MHVVVPVHVPQMPPQPSSPHSMPSQAGWQHTPSARQTNIASHWPQDPPQPSSPQVRAVQSGRQSTQRPSGSQNGVGARQSAPQVPPQPSGPHSRPEQSGTQTALQTPPEVQNSPVAHSPHRPPQPSSPQLRLPQSGTQSVAAWWFTVSPQALRPAPSATRRPRTRVKAHRRIAGRLATSRPRVQSDPR